MTGAKLPITVIGGYLGAGKTTLVNNLLTQANGLRAAVLVNDFGAVNIDAALIAEHAGDTISLTNGCMCCSMADGLYMAIVQIMKHAERLDHIIIEASGVAEPGKIARKGQAFGLPLDGVLVVDYPPEECEDFAKAMAANALDPIFLLAPTSTDARIDAVARAASGYIYYVSLKGVTGAATLDTSEVARRIPLIKSKTNIPVGVGFGIRDAATAKAVAAVADAVVIGSRIIQEMEASKAGDEIENVKKFMTGVRSAMDEVVNA